MMRDGLLTCYLTSQVEMFRNAKVSMSQEDTLVMMVRSGAEEGEGGDGRGGPGSSPCDENILITDTERSRVMSKPIMHLRRE